VGEAQPRGRRRRDALNHLGMRLKLIIRMSLTVHRVQLTPQQYSYLTIFAFDSNAMTMLSEKRSPCFCLPLALPQIDFFPGHSRPILILENASSGCFGPGSSCVAFDMRANN
jgi:hypothetical protein